MSNPQTRSRRKRTAVLIVHGMGSQRPLDTARGVVEAAWLEGDHSVGAERRIWTHPQLSGVDIDLPVITTNFVPKADHRRIDFHELYWAHLMSETRAVAVLLWLFELARRGPRLKPSIRALYWATLVFLALLVLSVSLLAIQFVILFIQRIALVAESPQPFIREFHSLVFVFTVTIAAASAFALIVSVVKRSFKLAAWSFLITAAAALIYVATLYHRPLAGYLTDLLLPALLAAVAVKFAMGRWGLVGLGTALVLSAAAVAFSLFCFKFYVHASDASAFARAYSSIPNMADFARVYELGWIPWSIRSSWSSIAAAYFIAIYLVLYAGFLQPYLGDAARYFRNSPANVAVRREIRKQAVDTLQALHLSGDYDRIVVVAHSLGAVVAYDMLRSYYSRVNQSLPDPSLLGSDFATIDRKEPARKEARAKGRAVIAEIERLVDAAQTRIRARAAMPGDEDLRAWLVTDFVTLGSPLTHAHYLMCRGKTEEELKMDFERRVCEREFPTCPPRNLDGDGRLTFENPNDHVRYFHHGGQFGLTRWTNLYFPVSQLLWGDAIGGPAAAVFGENIADLPVYESKAKQDSFFAHILYWHLPPQEGSKAPNIVALQNAIDLADTGIANSL